MYCFAFGINYIPFSTGNIFNQISVMWMLAWPVIALYIVYGKNSFKEWQKLLIVILIDIIIFSSDWSCIGVMIILAMYANRGNLVKQMKGFMIWSFVYAIVSLYHFCL